MYLQIENKFKKNSKIRISQLLFIAGVLLIAIICSMISKLIKSEENYWDFYALILLIGSFVFYVICYVFMFFIGLTKDKRTIKAFFSIGETIQAYQNRLHEEDIKILKAILEEHKINTRPKIEEAIKHYQCLLPRKISQTGQLLSILAFVISTLALLVSETVIASAENVGFILGIIFMITIFYALVRFIEKNIFRVFGKDAFYTRIEDSLSEIFMTYYLKKDSKTGEENNG